MRAEPRVQLSESESQSQSRGAAAVPFLIGGLAIVLVGLLLFGGDPGTKYTLKFQNAGQIVTGNEVLVGGRPIGKVDSVDLADDGQAELKINVNQPLYEGTQAAIRLTSLSGVANRYVSLTLGPETGPELEDGAVITGDKTTTAVDLDQIFNTLKPKARSALGDLIQGQATVYDSRGRQANQAYKYFAPALSSSQRLFAEINRDEQVFSQFLVQGSRAVGAIADRRDDLSSLVSTANTTLGAISNENDALRRSLDALPPTLRQANTTFVNLRTALDDLEPLVRDSLPATKDLQPFLSRLRPVASDSVPLFADLAKVVNRDGKSNDLADTLADLPTVRDNVDANVPRAITALDDSQDIFTFIRPYTPDLFGFLTAFGQSTGFYDDNGHYARLMPIGANPFKYNSGTNELDPIYSDPSQQYDNFDTGTFLRCPGGATQSAPDLSNPFLDDGRLAGQCDPTAVPPG